MWHRQFGLFVDTVAHVFITYLSLLKIGMTVLRVGLVPVDWVLLAIIGTFVIIRGIVQE